MTTGRSKEVFLQKKKKSTIIQMQKEGSACQWIMRCVNTLNTDLTLGITKAAVELQHLWPLLSQHQPCIEHTWGTGVQRSVNSCSNKHYQMALIMKCYFIAPYTNIQFYNVEPKMRYTSSNHIPTYGIPSSFMPSTVFCRTVVLICSSSSSDTYTHTQVDISWNISSDTIQYSKDQLRFYKCYNITEAARPVYLWGGTVGPHSSSVWTSVSIK